MRVFDDFTLPGFWRDPFPLFHRSFDAGLRIQRSPDGGLAVLGYDALRTFGMHPIIDGTPMDEAPDDPFANGRHILRHGLFTQVAPEHRRLRKAVLAGLDHASVKGFAHHARPVIERRVEVARDRPVDLFRDLCLPIATECWAAFAGYGFDDAEALGEAVEMFSRQLSFDPDPADAARADRAAGELLERTMQVVRSGRECPGRRIAAASEPADGAALVASLLFDAIDTAAAGLAGMLAVLLCEEHGVSTLADEPYRDLAIEEALRLATPTPFTVRQAREAAEIAGLLVETDTLVWMWWSAGNRDPEAFPEPERYRPGRAARGLPFGIGVHSCVGHGWTKQLAHLLVEAAFCGTRVLSPVSKDWNWTIGGARRPAGLMVVQR